MNRNFLVMGAVALLVGGFVYGATAYRRNQTEVTAAVVTKESAALSREGAQRLGAPDARVTIVEFFDPACETCAEFAPRLKAFVDQNPGRVQIVERYAPFHPGSDKVVAILEASRKQDKYWETLDTMFSTQAAWASHAGPNPELLWGFLEKAGLDVERLRVDMNDPAIAALIAQDLKDAKSLGITQTPEFFVNGKPLPTWGLRQLTELVDSELAAKY